MIRDEDVRRLDVAMNNPGGMSDIQALDELRAQFQDFVAFEAPLFQKSRFECLSLDQFHHDEGLTRVFADFVNRTDVGMIQRGGGAGLPFESRNADWIVAKRVRENLDRHLASQFLVLRPIHLSHATFSQGRDDFIVSERRARLNHQQIELRMGLDVNVASTEVTRRQLPDHHRQSVGLSGVLPRRR